MIVFEDGSVGVGYCVQGFEEESQPGATYEAFTQRLAHTLRQFPVGTVLQKVDSYYWDPQASPDAQCYHDTYAQRYHDTYAQPSERAPLRRPLQHQSHLYLIVGAPVYAGPHATFFVQGKALLSPPLQDLAARLAAVEQHAQELEATLGSYWQVERLSAAAYLAEVYAYFNLDFSGDAKSFEHTMHHDGADLRVGHKHVQVVSMRSQSSTPHYWGHNQLGHGDGVTLPFAWPLTHYLPFPHITVQTIRLLDTSSLMGRWSEELAWSESAARQERAQRQATSTHATVAAFDEALSAQGEVLVDMGLMVMVYDVSLLRLSEGVERTKAGMKYLGMQPMVETYDTANLFFAGQPGLGAQCYRGLPMALETALAQMNTMRPRQGAAQGILLADRHGTPLYYDPFNTALDNQHAFVFGPSGSGKSFFNGKMIQERYAAGHVVLVIDSGGTYRRLFEVLGGRYIEYSGEKPLGLNPFLIKKERGKYVPSVSKVNVLTQLLAKMWKGNLRAHPLAEAEKALLAKWIPEYYAQEQGIPTLRRFYDWLQGHPQEHAELFPFEDFFVVVAPFAHGVYAAHFNAPAVSHLADERLVCFELEALKRHPQLYPLVVQVLFDWAFDLVGAYPGKQKFIDIEEGWTMLDDYSEEHIEAFFRQGRKTQTAVRLITQDIAEVQGSRIAGAMLNNAATCILLYNDKASSRKAMGKFWGLSALEMEKYGSLRRGQDYREVLIKEMDSAHVWRVEASLYEHALLTSKPEERDRITALIEEHGDIQRGIAAWVREQGLMRNHSMV